MEDTISFKDNTSNANAFGKLQELSVRLNECFPKVYEEQDKVGGSWSQGLSQDRVWLGGPVPAHTHRVRSLPSPHVTVHSLTHSFLPFTNLC